ncbi:MAG: hypothetical protein U5M50_00860 [Sphingobium sp.]|nr:hypothetical protein [Sphingobium sp.]
MRFMIPRCRYLQMDDIFFALSCCDRHASARKKCRASIPPKLITAYTRSAWQAAVQGSPADRMLIGMHTLYAAISAPQATEGLRLAADAIFNQTGVDLFFME